MEHTSALRLVAVLLLNIALFAAPATAISQARTAVDLVQFNIAAQPMKDALKALAKQSDVQIIFTPSSVKELKAEKLIGEMATDQALDLLLRDTGLEHERAGDVVVVRDPKAKPVAAPTIPTAADAYLGSDRRDDVIRLAEAGGTLSTSAQNDKSSSETSHGIRRERAEEVPVDLGTVLVTGSLVRGAGSAGSPVIEITREDIERSGLPTISEVLQELPQNFGAGANDFTSVAGGQSSGGGNNIGLGSSVNLRGLGTDSTLVLVNGRRISPGSFANDFVDLSTIPLAAVERIEVLTDGASAIYGADAVAGVVNIILRDDFNGAETRARFGSSTAGDAEEIVFGQLLGSAWRSGSLFLAYEYFDRNNLRSEERAYTADSDLRPFGGDDFSSNASNPGNITDFNDNYAIPAGQDGTALSVDDLLAGEVNRQNIRLGSNILPEQRRHGAFLRVAQNISEEVTVTADARYGYREFENKQLASARFLSVPATNPFYVNPFGGSGPVFVNYSFLDDLGTTISSGHVESYSGSAGLDVRVGESWEVNLLGSHNADTTDTHVGNAVNSTALATALADPDPTTAFNPFGDGSNTNPATLASISGGFIQQDAESSVSIVQLKGDGNLYALPGGDLKLAVGAEYREESFEFVQSTLLSGSVPSIGQPNKGDRNVVAGFAEFYIPFVGAANAQRGVRRLDLSIAGRFEDHSDFGSTVDPKFGLLWSPVDGISMRGTYGTSFKAPLLSQLQTSKFILLLALPDPESASGSTNTLLILGTREGLIPEEATTYTLGLELAPPKISGLNVRLNYFNVEIDGRIRLPSASVLNLLGNDSFSSITIRDPSAEEVIALYNDPGFLGTPIPPEEVGAIVDDRVSNIAQTEISGIDLLLSYALATRAGSFDFRANGSYLLDHRVAVTGSAPLVDLVSTIGHPVDFRAQASASWRRHGFSAGAAINYVDDYMDTDSEPDRRVGSWTTVDLRLAYSTGERFAGGPLDDVTIALAVQNILDEDPPFANIAIGVGFDAVNASAMGRFAALQVVKRW